MHPSSQMSGLPAARDTVSHRETEGRETLRRAGCHAYSQGPALPTEGMICMISVQLSDSLVTAYGHHESMDPKCQHLELSLAPKLDPLVVPSQSLPMVLLGQAL